MYITIYITLHYTKDVTNLLHESYMKVVEVK